MEYNLLDDQLHEGSSLMADPTQVLDEHMASSGKRFANFLIDRIVIYFLSIFLGIFVTLFTKGNRNFFTETFLQYFLYYALEVIYYTILESTTGKTVGKMVTKTRVVCDDFSRPSFGTIFLRTLCRLIPFEAFSCLGNPPKGWHDTINRTWVVRDNLNA
jgi:uncharacterized RDD family membrane protein YckC